MRLDFLVVFLVVFTLVNVTVTVSVAQGQNNLAQMDIAHQDGPRIFVSSQTLSNDLQFTHVRSNAFTASTLVVNWSFKPALELKKAGTGEGMARCVSQKLSLDSAAWTDGATWRIDPDGACIQGPLDTTSFGWSQDFFDAIMFPPSKATWPMVQNRWLEEWNEVNTPADHTMDRVKAQLLFTAQHPYGELDFPETIQAITDSDIRAHHASYWHPNNSQFYWFTPFDTDHIPSAWLTQLERWPAHPIQASAVSTPSQPRNMESAMINRDSDTVQVCLAHIIRMKPEHADALTLKMIEFNLSQSIPASFELTTDPIIGSLTAGWESTPSSAAVEVKRTLRAMRQMTQRAMSDSSLLELRTTFIQNQTALHRNWPNQSARHIDPHDVYWLQHINHLDSIVQSIDATDLQRVAINYLRPENLYVILDGNQEKLEDIAREFSAADELKFFDHMGRQLSNYGPVPEGLRPLELIEYYYEACGGLDSFERLRSARRRGKVVAGGAMEMAVNISETYGTGSRITYSMEGQAMMEYILTPHQGISIQMGQQRPMNSSEYRRYEHSLYAAHLLHLEDLGLSGEIVGTTQRDGAELIVMELRRDGKLEQSLFFDAQSYLLMRALEERSGPTGPVMLSTEYGNYQSFGDLKFPTQIAQRSNNQQMQLTIESIELNPRIDQSTYTWE